MRARVLAMDHKSPYVRSSAGIVATCLVKDLDMLSRLEKCWLVQTMMQVVQEMPPQKTPLPCPPCYLWPILWPGFGNPTPIDLSCLTDPASVMCYALAKPVEKEVQISQRIVELEPSSGFMRFLEQSFGGALRAQVLLLVSVPEGACDPHKEVFCKALVAAGYQKEVYRLIRPDDAVLTEDALDAFNLVIRTLGERGLPPMESVAPLINATILMRWSGTSHLMSP